MEYRVDFATQQNRKDFDKPNEDFIFVDENNGIFIVLDGVTRDKIDDLYPQPSPSYEVSKIFADKAYAYIIDNFSKNIDTLTIIKNAFAEGNAEIKRFNRSYTGDFLPGTVGIIAIIKENKLYYGYIGDCLGVLLNEQARKEFTTCQTKLIHEHIKYFTAFEIRNYICNHHNHPYSYGVLDGRESAIDFVVTEMMALDKYKELVLATDGVEDTVRQMPINELLFSNAQDLVTDKIYNKSTDDKTVIIVRFTTDENNDQDS